MLKVTNNNDQNNLYENKEEYRQHEPLDIQQVLISA
jgi:hypothetical protein